MGYQCTLHLALDLEKKGYLKRIHHEVDPYLEMAEIQRQTYKANGPALLFEHVKGSPFKAVSNLFGTQERMNYIFRDSLPLVKKIMNIKGDPRNALKHPFKTAAMVPGLISALPKKVSPSKAPVLWGKTTIDALPGVVSWQKDGGRYITLPQVYTEHPDGTGPFQSNLGMYRIQLDGNSYEKNEIGLHYQIHRGIAHHHQECLKKNLPLKVTIFIGGPPAMTVAAVMPLPDNVPEVLFAGLLGKRRFAYTKVDGFTIAADADFCITGTIEPGAVKPEGPFGDHLGYYSLTHDMPVMKVEDVYYREDALWPFTVVGRPPQEDTEFGNFIHHITRSAVSAEVSGLKEVHAVDEAGVHPLLLAIGSDHYVPYLKRSRPAELLTVANGILGSGQLSLAKYLLIAAHEDNQELTTGDVKKFIVHILERVNWERDIHFLTKTTIDTLDYSGDGLNEGSKVIIAAIGKPVRKLKKKIQSSVDLPKGFSHPLPAAPGILVIQGPPFEEGKNHMTGFTEKLSGIVDDKEWPLVVVVDDSSFTSGDFTTFLWTTFTRSNPAADIYGIESFISNKHWGCRGSLVIDARIKPHHAPPLEVDREITLKAETILKDHHIL